MARKFGAIGRVREGRGGAEYQGSNKVTRGARSRGRPRDRNASETALRLGTGAPCGLRRSSVQDLSISLQATTRSSIGGQDLEMRAARGLLHRVRGRRGGARVAAQHSRTMRRGCACAGREGGDALDARRDKACKAEIREPIRDIPRERDRYGNPVRCEARRQRGADSKPGRAPGHPRHHRAWSSA